MPFPVSSTLSRLNLFEQLPAAPNSPRLDALGHFPQRIIFGLAGVAGQRLSFVRPVLALIDAGAFSKCVRSALACRCCRSR